MLLINAIVGALQEGRAEASASALQEMMRVRARVRRDGREQSVDATALVPGDVVLLSQGDAVPADVRLLSSEDLEVDESPLTGESTPVAKNAGDAVAEEAVVGERTTMAFAGSTVMNGEARGIVCRIGRETQVGQIAESLAKGESQAPPLVLKLRRFTRQIALFVLLAVLLLSVTQLVQGAALERDFLPRGGAGGFGHTRRAADSDHGCHGARHPTHGRAQRDRSSARRGGGTGFMHPDCQR